MARGLISMLFIALLAPFAHAQTIEALVDPPVVGPGETFQLRVTVRGQNIGEPILPETTEVQIDARNVRRSFSSEFKFINGQQSMTQMSTWQYACSASKIGTWVIPAIKVMADGQELSSRPLTVKVVDRPARPSRRSAPRRQWEGVDNLEDAVRAESRIDKAECFEGETLELVVALKVLQQPGLRFDHGGQPYFAPETPGFYTTQPVREQSVREEDGYLWEIQEFHQLLFPTQTGDLTIASWQIQGDVYALLPIGRQAVRVNAATEPLTVHVKPLPPAPAGFSGAVGKFQVAVALDKEHTLQAVPVEMQIQITGTGNPNIVQAPPLPQLDWAQVSQQTGNATGQQYSTQVAKTFVYSITPHLAGNHQIPPLDFIYFDPEEEAYKTVSTRTLPLSVTPAEGEGPVFIAGGSGSNARADIAVLGQDLRPIVTEGVDLRPARSGLPLNAVAAALPPCAFLIFAGYLRRKRYFDANPHQARRQFAHSRNFKRLQAAADSATPSESIFRALAGLAADHYDMNEAGMTSQDVRELLEGNGIAPDVVEPYIKVLRACERAGYSGASLGRDEIAALQHAGADAMDRLERAWRGR